MIMAADLSRRLGLIDAGAAQRVREAVAAAGLPVRAPRWPFERWVELMSVDKKAERGTPKFVLLESIGQAVVRRAPDDALRATIEAAG